MKLNGRITSLEKKTQVNRNRVAFVLIQPDSAEPNSVYYRESDLPIKRPDADILYILNLAGTKRPIFDDA